MNARSVSLATLVTLLGAAFCGGLYWMLLNVPESNVLALLLSALLLVLIVVLAGYCVSTVLGVASGWTPGRAVRAGGRGVTGFLSGLAVAAVLASVTLYIGDSWSEHSGEIDALFLRYGGTANSAWIHTAVTWLLWLLRWGVGTALVAGATTGRLTLASITRGFGLAFSPVPLGATLAGLVGAWGMWTFAYWRPKGLPADSAELAFVSVKVSLLLLGYAVIAALVAHAFARSSASSETGVSTVSS